MTSRPYGLLCPITKACEILQPRWTLPILSEMWMGASRFSDIRRALGGISPGVLSRRLTEMEAAGLIERVEDRAKGTVDYLRTRKAVDLEPALLMLAEWAQQHIDAEVALSGYDLPKMMRDFCGGLHTDALPDRRVVIRFHFSDEDGAHPTYWLLSRPGVTSELCVGVPNLDTDLFVETTKVSFAAVIMGRSTLARERDLGRMFVSGDAVLERTMRDWFPISRNAGFDRIAQLPDRLSGAKMPG